ncbi:substrate-binding domain-containing protein [Streptomyces sp. MRC013]|uniref:substrate-binding domain-containing protein n=1 Tax=Streptomyces sp. MRC013 TaxID=2898276 RepID=UPI0020269ED3|nr:substrate-binding domain-containing protein [Streptomyces sp. MRC013]URM89279.1 substrate-binding domain-containing protein [Streptomyces sp. MRC013]
MSSTALSPVRTGTVRLGYHGSPRTVSRIVRLAAWHPDAVRLGQYDINDPFKEVKSGGLDVMVAKFGLREPDLVASRVLLYEERAVVVGEAHPLARRDDVSIEELADYEAFDSPGRFPGYVWDEVVPRHTPTGRPLRRVHHATDVPHMMRLVGEGRAVHISLTTLADVAPPGIKVVPIHDLPPAPVLLAWARGSELPDAVREFIAAAEEGASR